MNYTQLTEIYNELNKYGLEILDFPSNDFLNQEPKTNPQIKSWVHEKYNSKFLLFEKIHVNGPKTSEIYIWLRQNSEFYDAKTKQ